MANFNFRNVSSGYRDPELMGSFFVRKLNLQEKFNLENPVKSVSNITPVTSTTSTTWAQQGKDRDKRLAEEKAKLKDLKYGVKILQRTVRQTKKQ